PGGLDLDLGAVFEELGDDEQGHRGKVTANRASVGLADLTLAREVGGLVSDVPVDTHKVPRFAARFLEHAHDILERLLGLRDEVVANDLRLVGPADLSGNKHLSALGDDAVGIALRRLPLSRLKNLEFAHAPTCSRNLKRWIFPVWVLGNAATKFTARGYL